MLSGILSDEDDAAALVIPATLRTPTRAHLGRIVALTQRGAWFEADEPDMVLVAGLVVGLEIRPPDDGIVVNINVMPIGVARPVCLSFTSPPLMVRLGRRSSCPASPHAKTRVEE